MARLPNISTGDHENQQRLTKVKPQAKFVANNILHDDNRRRNISTPTILKTFSSTKPLQMKNPLIQNINSIL